MDNRILFFDRAAQAPSWLALALALGSLTLVAAPSAAAADPQPVSLDHLSPTEHLPGHLDAAAMLQLAAPATNKPPTLNGMVQLDMGLDLPHFQAFAIPRLRFDDLRHPKASAAFFFQQIWAAVRGGPGTLKAGKIIGQFGRVWDYGLYGPLLANTDVKMTPDYGLSLEATHKYTHGLRLFWAAQYFPIDGKAFRILDNNPFTAAHARRLHTSAVRLQPSISLGPGRLSLGVSGQHFRSVRRELAHVWRSAADLDYSQSGFDAFVEVGRQFGSDVPSSDTTVVHGHSYLWAGAQKAVGPVLLRHHVNLVFYPHGTRFLDVLHQPGAEWIVAPTFSLIAEAAFWHNLPNVVGRGDASFFLVAMGRI